MNLSSSITQQIHSALVAGDWNLLDAVVVDHSRLKGKHARALIRSTVNSDIVKYAIQEDKPEILAALHDIPQENADEILSSILKVYFATKNEQWFRALLELPEKMGKKSLQSQMFSHIAHILISTGISKSDPTHITQGIEVLNRITFKKYKSDAIITSTPPILKWIVSSDDISILHHIQNIINEINDISKQGILHADVAQTIAIVAIHTKNWNLYLDSIKFSASICQKLRRRDCLVYILSLGAKSDFKTDIFDIRVFTLNFDDYSYEIQEDIVNALTIQLLNYIKNKNQLNDILKILWTKQHARETIIYNLISTGESSADLWYLLKAIKGVLSLPTTEKKTIKEIVRVGMGIARQSRSSNVLESLIPFVEKKCSNKESAEIFLQFVNIMLLSGDFENAVKLFRKVPLDEDTLTQYSNSLTKLLEGGIIHNQSALEFKEILDITTPEICSDTIKRAVHQVSHESPFTEIDKHCDSFKQLLTLHPASDALILESITILINRKFLDSWDSSLLVNLAKSIRDPSVREQALSIVVINLAEIAVRAGNRDFLQQAVGITCLIDGQTTRSATLSSIIDDAALLAAAQGDLDLLLRMRIWSSSLLDHDLVTCAMTNIVYGVIKYATGKQTPEALSEAYVIARDIEDPISRMQLCEQIAESYVRIGCAIMQNNTLQKTPLNRILPIKSFETGLHILKTELPKPRLSLKIAGMIDIILFFSKKDSTTHYILPLALYSLEIEDPLERNAMLSRIVANLNVEVLSPDSGDPYVVLAYSLQRQYQSQSTPETIELIYRLLNQIRDPFVRLKGLCMLADSAVNIHEPARAQTILDDVFLSVSLLPAEYQKALIMADLTIGYHDIDSEKAEQCLDKALKILNTVETDKDAVVRCQIVSAIVSMNGILPDDKRTTLIINILAKLSDPREYIKAFIAAQSLFREDKDIFNLSLRQISEAIERIDSPYDQALLILETVPLTLKNNDNDLLQYLLKKSESLIKNINIPYIADTLREERAKLHKMLASKHKKSQYLTRGPEILGLVEDEELYQQNPSRINRLDISQEDITDAKIMALAMQVIKEGNLQIQIVTLERRIRAFTDRGKRAILFCRLSLLFRNKGDLKIAKRLLNNAIREAEIIRPLSKRAYIECDMAMKLYSAGYVSTAEDILDNAIDAATNIRQATLRDDVFNELGLAIKIMQGMHV